MTTTPKPSAARADRLADRLRENLKRRKAQARARRDNDANPRKPAKTSVTPDRP